LVVSLGLRANAFCPLTFGLRAEEISQLTFRLRDETLCYLNLDLKAEAFYYLTFGLRAEVLCWLSVFRLKTTLIEVNLIMNLMRPLIFLPVTRINKDNLFPRKR
jgi:hypothetical protein